MFDLKLGLRTRSEAAVIETADINDMISFIKADTLEIVENKEGVQYLHVVNSTNPDEYFTIKVGAKVTGLPTGQAMIPALVDNFTIYTGLREVDNTLWFTFGPEPTSREAVVKMSVAELLGRKSVAGAKA